MLLRCIDPVAPVDVVLLGRVVQPGEVVDVAEEHVDELLSQVGNWQPADEDDDVAVLDAAD